MTTLTTGPAEVFETVYAAHRSRVRAMFYGWLNDWATAEDLTQDLFMQLWQDLDSGKLVIEQPESLPTSFLRNSARWIYGRYQHSRVPQASLNADDDMPFDHTRAALRTATPAADETIPATLDLGRTLAILPAPQRRAVALHYLEDLPKHEVAAQTGYAERTITNYLAKALCTLREAEGLPTRTVEAYRGSAARDKNAAIEAYRASVSTGKPLTLATLGARFGRSERWALRVLQESGEHRPQANTETHARTQLREEIAAGAWQPGARITCAMLAERFALDTSCASRVLRVLTAEKLIEKRTEGRRTIGYFVTAPATLAKVIPLRPRTAHPATAGSNLQAMAA